MAPSHSPVSPHHPAPSPLPHYQRGQLQVYLQELAAYLQQQWHVKTVTFELEKTAKSLPKEGMHHLPLISSRGESLGQLWVAASPEQVTQLREQLTLWGRQGAIAIELEQASQPQPAEQPQPASTVPENADGEDKFEKIFAHSNDAIFVIDPSSDRILEANPQACKLLGYDHDELINHIAISTVHPKEMPAMMAFAKKVLDSGEGWTDQLSCTTKEGCRIPAEISAATLQYEGKTCLLAHVRDLEARQELERSIQEREHLASLSLAVSEALVQGDVLGKMIFRCTEAMVNHLNGSLARIWLLNETTNTLELLASSGMVNAIEKHYCYIPIGKWKIGTIAESRQPHLTNDLLSDPEFSDREWAEREGVVSLAGYPLVVADRLVGMMVLFGRQSFTPVVLEGMAAIANGIASAIVRQQGAAELRRSEEQLRQLAENMRQVFWLYDGEGQPLYVSPAFEKIWGIPCGDWYENPEVWREGIIPSDRHLVCCGVKIPEQTREISDIPDVGPLDREYWVQRPDGTRRLLRDRTFAIRNEYGEIERLAGIAEDITKRKQEQQKMLKALKRLAEIGELAATIVHEVRNPLTTVLMGLMSFKSMDLPERAQMRLALSMDEAERLQRLLNEILLYAKPQSPKRDAIELNQFVEELLPPLREMPAAAEHTITFQSCHAAQENSEMVMVQGDRDKLKQVFINLIVNACEASPKGETVSVTLNLETADTPSIALQSYVEAVVRNGGEPIPPDILPKLTKPFQTTKANGNGLGLAIVKRIVEAHGGELTIASSQQLQGTVVSVKLPLAEET